MRTLARACVEQGIEAKREVEAAFGVKVDEATWAAERKLMCRRAVPTEEGPQLLPGPKPKMSTEEAKAAVKAVLAKNVYLTTELRYDRENKRAQQIFGLKTSRVFLENPELKRHMQETTGYQHLKKLCSEYRTGKTRSALRDVCLNYGRRVMPRLRNDISKTKHTLEEKLPGYWAPFEQVRKDTAEEPRQFANPEHVQFMIADMRQHRYRRFPWDPENQKSFGAPDNVSAQGPAQGSRAVF